MMQIKGIHHFDFISLPACMPAQTKKIGLMTKNKNSITAIPACGGINKRTASGNPSMTVKHVMHTFGVFMKRESFPYGIGGNVSH